MEDELQFNEELHQYTVGGVILPSVTTIISAVGLYEFDHVSNDTLAVAAERGRHVHSMIELYEKGVLDEDSIDPELRGYFDGYLGLKSSGMIPEHPDDLELRGYSKKYQYAGTLDMTFGRAWIHDHKTGSKSPTHGLQLSAYWLMFHPDINDKPEHLTCGYYTRLGEWQLVEYPYEPLAWLAVFADYKWRLKNNLIKPRWT